MVKHGIALEHPARRQARMLALDMFTTLPFLQPWLRQLGEVRACPENGERLLNRDELVAVFPEGVKGVGKYFRDRYRVARFGRGGFVRLAIRTRSPIVPVSVVGAEEIYPSSSGPTSSAVRSASPTSRSRRRSRSSARAGLDPGADEVVDRHRQADRAGPRPGVRRAPDDRQRGDRPRPVDDPADDRLTSRPAREPLHGRVDPRAPWLVPFRAASRRRGDLETDTAGRSLRPCRSKTRESRAYSASSFWSVER